LEKILQTYLHEQLIGQANRVQSSKVSKIITADLLFSEKIFQIDTRAGRYHDHECADKVGQAGFGAGRIITGPIIGGMACVSADFPDRPA